MSLKSQEIFAAFLFDNGVTSRETKKYEHLCNILRGIGLVSTHQIVINYVMSVKQLNVKKTNRPFNFISIDRFAFREGSNFCQAHTKMAPIVLSCAVMRCTMTACVD